MCIGNEETNQLMKDWLERTIHSIDWAFERKGNKVLEVMSGNGRNYEVLAKKFKLIEMLDGSEGMIANIKSQVVKHHSYI